MRSPSLIAVAGPSGGGKTSWIVEQLQHSTQPTVYVSPGLGPISVDLARINYTFPAVQIIAGDRDESWLATKYRTKDVWGRTLTQGEIGEEQ